ncbi:class I SAM-dependent methyltransferase [Bdellovibrionota bacterium FG-1]
MYTEIEKCRICGNTDLVTIMNLGNSSLTGVFPRTPTEAVGSFPLELVKCTETPQGNTCGLVQLRHTGELGEMYGMNYGYLSSLNHSMVTHLNNKIKKILARVQPKAGDLVIDIGSNDSTTLQAYPKDLTLLGVDPTGVKFKHLYPSHIGLIPDFFSAKAVQAKMGAKKAKIITSISMFYDLEDPTAFVEQVYECLDSDGVWILEQSYLPTMLETNSYDTICHEHLEYYALKQIKWLADKVGFCIIDLEKNDINGGSFSLMLRKKQNANDTHAPVVDQWMAQEHEMGLHTLKPYIEFGHRVEKHCADLVSFLTTAKKNGQKVLGYGASTKGNVLLQYCKITRDELPYIAEVNPDKYGRYTPGTQIPIISEPEAKDMQPDYFLVLPWHFREGILKRETAYLKSGGKFVFPLPNLSIVSGE